MGRLSQGQMVAAVGGIVLLVAMWLPWVGISGPSLPSGLGGIDTSTSDNIWKSSSLDVYLVITAVVALLPALMALTDSAEEFSFVSAAALLLGVVAVIAFLTVDFPDGGDRKYGAFVGLGGAIVIAVGGFRAMQEEVAGEI